MAKSSDSNSREESFDLDRFRKLLQLMEKYGVNEVALQNEGESWKIRRGPRQVAVAPEQVVQAAAPAPVVAPAAAPAPAPAPAPAAAAPSAPEAVTINAPTIGTFYSAPTPEDSAFVSVGSVVQPDTVVCIIEAMKVFNEVHAEKAGRIAEILVQNGDAVSFGQPLFRIEPV